MKLRVKPALAGACVVTVLLVTLMDESDDDSVFKLADVGLDELARALEPVAEFDPEDPLERDAEEEREHHFGCVDQVDSCGGWAVIGECASNKLWMLEHCPGSCNINCAAEVKRMNAEKRRIAAARRRVDAQKERLVKEEAAAKAAADAAGRVAARLASLSVPPPADIAKEDEMAFNLWGASPPSPSVGSMGQSSSAADRARIAAYGDVDSPNPAIAAMARRNTEQQLQNADKFGPLLWDDPSLVVIVIMSHNRALNLEVLFDSLRKAAGISKALVVISQDFADDALDAAIARVDFCLLLRIFLPASTQLHPKEFPGTDPRDCLVKKANDKWYTPREARAAGCLNKESPDMYGHYREAGYTAIKHHWWWKISFVFDHIKVLSNHPGPKVFIEEDNYLSPDALKVSQLLAAALGTTATNVGLFSLGTYDTPTPGLEALAESVPWDPTKHNQGMGFTRTFWERLKGCRQMFCDYDDYNWDWTLLRLSANKCFDQKAISWSRASSSAASGLRTLLLRYPRSFHTGECGVHFKGKKCDPAGVVAKIERNLQSAAQSLYPSSLQIDTSPSRKAVRSPVQPNGGWGDVRDRALCMDMASD